MEKLDPLTGLNQLLLSQLAGPLGLLHHCPQLLQLCLQQVVPPLHNGDVLLQVLIDPHHVIQLQLGVLQGSSGVRRSGEGGRLPPNHHRGMVRPATPQLLMGQRSGGYLEETLQCLDLLLGLGGHAVGMAELDLHLVKVALHLLLQPQGLITAPGLSIQ